MKNKRRKIRNCTKKQANLSSKIAGAIAIISVVLILGILVRENFGMNSLSYNLITGALVGDNSVDLATSDSPAKTLPAEISLAAAPSITSIILNSSTSVNDTAHNLTLWLTGSDADGDAFRNITNWYLNGNSLLLLNLPFEGGSNSTWTRDYGSGNNATVAGAAWNASRGYARFGAYTFEGVNDYLSIPDSNLLDLTSPFTIEFRFMPNQTFNHSADYYQGLLDKGTYQIYLDKSDGKLKFYLDSNATENWSAVGLGMDLDVTSLVVFNGELYAAGAFTTAGGINANYTAKWNGTDWSTLGLGTSSDEGTPNVDALIVYKNELYAGGQFNSAGGLSANKIAKWNGTSWGALGSGMGNGRVLSQAIYRGDLYLGGSFTTAGSVGANRTAKWNNTNWSGLGTGTNNVVNALIVYNGDLYAGGSFTTAGGVGANRTAKWNGTHWSGLGSGMNNIVYSLVLYNGELYAGGMFTTAGSVGANRTAKWNGTDWSVLGSGVNSTVDSLTVNNGELYAGGTFTSAGGLGANYIAKWNGTDWSALGSGTNSSIYSSVVYNGDLYVGGAFTSAGGVSANYSARWSSGAKEIASVTNNFSTTWQHLAITYNQTNLSLYLNGVLENSIITSIIPSTNSLALWLGATYGSSGPGYFNGTIDEVRIYNRSLSSPEITALYQNRTDLIVSNELRAGNIWKACVTPNDLTVDGNESCSNNLTILNTAPSISSLILNTTNLSSNTTAQNLTAYVLTNDIDSDSIKSIYNWYVNGTSITLLNLPFEGRSNSTWTRDYAQGKNGTVVNATWNSTGGYDGKGAYQFNGNNSYISTGSGINLTRGGTIVAWINPRNTLGYQTIVASGHAGGSTSSFNLFVDSGVLRAVFYNGTDFIGQTSGTFNATNQWSQIIWAFNGQTGFLYINKVLQSQTSSFRKSSTYPNTVIGALNTNPATDHFNGSIDEVLIFNRSLSSPEITALYQNRTDLIVSNELAAGDIWKTCVTPNDGTVDGTESCSNNLTVLRTDNSPEVNLSSPAAGYSIEVESSTNIIFSCNTTDDYLLKNVSLYLTNSTNQSFILNQSTNISGIANSSNWTIELGRGNYTWNCLVNDNASKEDWGINRSFTINVAAAISAPPPSGGGEPPCTSSWDCTSWSVCLPSLKQTRTCLDSNACQKSYLDERECTKCLEDWVCSSWSECFNQTKIRNCMDNHNCGTMGLKPNLVQFCEEGINLLPLPPPPVLLPPSPDPSPSKEKPIPGLIKIFPPWMGQLIQKILKKEPIIPPIESEKEQPVPKPEEIVPPKNGPLVGEAFGSGLKSPPEKYIYNLLWLVFFILLIILFLLIIKHSSRRGESSLEELKEWIGHEKKMGIPDEQSIKILLQHTAWSKEEITRAFNELDLNNIGSKKIKKD